MAQRILLAFFCLSGTFALALQANAQFANKWLSAGDFHNWYSETGAECEECGFVRTLQDGWRWPGSYPFTSRSFPHTDIQISKGLWIGATDVTGPSGATYPFRVVHVGPRVTGAGEFFPVRFQTVSKRPLPVVTVNGEPSVSRVRMEVDRVEPDLTADIMIETEVNTLLGITLERRVMQFSQDYHDDYHLVEYVFTNTGNTDADTEIELPGQTLEGVYFFMPYRLAINAISRFAIGNPTGWGRNTMNDARGDGVLPDPVGEEFRAQFAWHGNFPSFTGDYDNLGAPLMPPAVPAFPVADADTVGRFASAQFAGVVTIHADASATDERDDRSQPSTTTWFGSDDQITSINDAFNLTKMQQEYALMSSGHKSPRHAYAVEPSGREGFLNPTQNPALGTTGGYSFANGYGPYTLAPGESVRIVFAEAAGGLSREATFELGRQFKASGGDASAALTYDVGGTPVSLTKNEWVFTSRDSLFQTFRRALANYESDYGIPAAPAPPATFSVSREDDRITLSWEPLAGEPDPTGGWDIYRAEQQFDGAYTLIHTASPDERSYDDLTTSVGSKYYYYIAAVGEPSSNDGTGLTPTDVPLRSSRYYTQTYAPLQGILPVANEGSGSGAPSRLRLHAAYPHPFADRATIPFDLPDPTAVTLVVYDIRGAEVARLRDGEFYPRGTHTITWNADDLPSGLYVLRMTTENASVSGKLMLVR